MPTTREQILGTAGHIDHGKTALVRALTGVDTDRLPAEKQRGITIDLGFAALDLGRRPPRPGRRAGPRAVHPQHARRRHGPRPGPARRRGRRLGDAPDPRAPGDPPPARALGAGVVALTKCDLADPDWLALVEDDVRALVAGTFLEGAADRPDLGRDRPGDRRPAAVAGREPARRRTDGPTAGSFRMAIDRSFTVAGHGTVVTGTVASGRSPSATSWRWFPRGGPSGSAALQHHDQAVDRVGRGPRAAINLGGVHHERDPPRPGAGRRRAILVRPRDPLGRRPGLGRRPPTVAAPGAVIGSTWGRPRSRPRWRCSTAPSCGPATGLRAALPGRAGGRRLRPAVRAPRGEPARDRSAAAGSSSRSPGGSVAGDRIDARAARPAREPGPGRAGRRRARVVPA